ncbi:amidohydrolase family protein [Sphingomonas crocodyli]|uniref:Amidohydrolase n=1 Tax=Sphingomonas crocodyli TaxID=1979270 RepID=A0A437LWL3_9SPHN|nr:amidohydrolase family protein [Sphingomonas crocodyli]RVT89788.1 amidohydrolase [Sphingomonas crocodyli]
MGFPTDQKIIDLMLSLPSNNKGVYDSFKPLLRDKESLSAFDFPAQYMFKDVPDHDGVTDRIGWLLNVMDRYNIERAFTGVNPADPDWQTIQAKHRDRFLFCAHVDPNGGMETYDLLREWHRDYRIDGVGVFPAGCVPQVPIDDRRMWPIYAFCCEKDLPIFINVGVPGPRVPLACQRVELIDEVCWFFPELKFVMRHGAEPWQDLAVKLMLKYPNLYYSTSAFAPKHYPKSIIDYANTRGADKIMYSGYSAGLKMERIFDELPRVPFTDAVWPKFLYENAAKLFKL